MAFIAKNKPVGALQASFEAVYGLGFSMRGWGFADTIAYIYYKYFLYED